MSTRLVQVRSEHLERSIRLIAAATVVLMVLLALAPPASAQTVEDIETRDSLIANQENLLNAYRCRFKVDLNIVPRGCSDRRVVTPGAAPPNPTQQDIDARDGLIRSQENLLNAYRCRFGIDTHIVPGGCVDDTTADPQTTAISAGPHHSCAIRSDSTIVCWGDNRYGQADPPAGRFTAVTAGTLHTCAIKADSTIVCWGYNSFGLYGDNGPADAPSGEFTAIDAGPGNTCAIRTNGTIACWGDNRDGEADPRRAGSSMSLPDGATRAGSVG